MNNYEMNLLNGNESSHFQKKQPGKFTGRKVLQSTLISSAVLSVIPHSSFAQDNKNKQDSERPNIVFIMSDDHSFQTISAYDHRYVKTPNIDRIARDGAIFTNSFVANSISGPSRACMLTGKHSHKNGFTDNSRSFDGSQQTFPKLLQKAGYETAIVGKWHLASNPTGFNYWNILIGQGHYYNPDFIDNGKNRQIEGYATNIITDLAIDWMQNKRDKNKPFCLLLHHKAPHRTWMPDTCDLGAFDKVKFPMPANFYDKYEGRVAASQQEMSIIKDMNLVYDLKMADKEKEICANGDGLADAGRSMYNALKPDQKSKWDAYYNPIIEDFKKRNLSGKELAEWKYQRYMHDYMSVILSVDRNIGRVLDYLEKEGLLDNTLVVYTSDQGFYMGEHGWFDKRFMYEESMRTPLLMHFPKGYKKQGQIKQLVQNIDYAPTFLELAGVKAPADIQGVSLVPLMQKDKPKDWRESLYYHFYEYPAEHAVKRHCGIRTNRYKLIHFYYDINTWELYDLKKDPTEMHNLYGQPKYNKLTKELKAKLEGLQVKYDDTNPLIKK
jgi:arylsulfatase A-like enzyme